jgi:hypothetical protein
MADAHQRSIPPRPLEPDELRILTLLLAQDFAGADDLRAQLPFVRVVGRCTCGCATVDLEVGHEGSAPAVRCHSPLPSEAQVRDMAGETAGGILIFLEDGWLASLEIYAYGDPITAWPADDRLSLSRVER